MKQPALTSGNRRRVLAIALVAVVAQAMLAAQQRGGPGNPRESNVFRTEVPPHDYDIVLARPNRQGVTVSVLAYKPLQGYVQYDSQPATYSRHTPTVTYTPDQPQAVTLMALEPGRRYYYRFMYRMSGDSAFKASEQYTFRTAQPAGADFTFTVTADSHLDENTTPDLYLQTLRNALLDKPDLHIDLGDTFMTEKHPTRDSALKQYIAQRYYFGQLCHSAPLFLVLGNHDGETAREQDGTANSLAVWAAQQRRRLFPNPVSDSYYTGNTHAHPLAGELQDYYAWQWGDALFVVLDPFWYTPRQRRTDDNWTRTLGDDQYHWLVDTLHNSRAKYKFVFIHHLVGGLDKDARGGIEAAPLYEWGGHNADGSEGFAAHRPGWDMDIHHLFVREHVSVVFHGHDHLFAKQVLDGVVYQETPQPGWQGRYDENRTAEYGYKAGTILASSGYLRVKVTGQQAQIEYVGTAPEGQNGNRQVRCSYTVPPGK